MKSKGDDIVDPKEFYKLELQDSFNALLELIEEAKPHFNNFDEDRCMDRLKEHVEACKNDLRVSTRRPWEL